MTQKYIGKACLLAVSLLLVGFQASCKRQQKVQVEIVEDEGERLATMIHVADPRASVQLLRGFHDIEQNAWRWTMGKFAVTLRPPVGASEKGAILHLKFSVPDPVIERLHSITLTANVSGAALPPETYTKPGEYVYTRDVPPLAFKGEAVVADFALNKYLHPGEADSRELGVVVTTVGFEAK